MHGAQPPAKGNIAHIPHIGGKAGKKVAVAKAAADNGIFPFVQFLTQGGFVKKVTFIRGGLKEIFLAACPHDDSVVAVIDDGMDIVVASHQFRKEIINIIDKLDVA